MNMSWNRWRWVFWARLLPRWAGGGQVCSPGSKLARRRDGATNPRHINSEGQAKTGRMMDNSLHSGCIFWSQKATIMVEEKKKKGGGGGEGRRENMKLWGRMWTNRNRSMKEYWYNPVDQELRWQIDLSHPKVYQVVCFAWNKGLRRILKVERDLWWISDTCSWQQRRKRWPIALYFPSWF